MGRVLRSDVPLNVGVIVMISASLTMLSQSTKDKWEGFLHIHRYKCLSATDSGTRKSGEQTRLPFLVPAEALEKTELQSLFIRHWGPPGWASRTRDQRSCPSHFFLKLSRLLYEHGN